MTTAKKAAAEVIAKYGPGLTGKFRQAWNEIPEIVATTAMALVGVGLAFKTLIHYRKNDGDNREYKMHYTIMRPDDPRAERVRKLQEKEKAKSGAA